MEKRYDFPTFQHAMSFASIVAMFAERAKEYPVITINGKSVSFNFDAAASLLKQVEEYVAREKVAEQARKGKEGWGMIQLYTGLGKGKTTAALGQAIRAVSKGKRVAIIYFDKGGDHYAERKIISERFKSEIDFWATGRDRIDTETGKFIFGVTDEDRVEAQRGKKLSIDALVAKKYDLVICDEVNTSVSLGMLELHDALEIIRSKPPEVELVLTGRNCPPELIAEADLATEMRLLKHYFYFGTPAREGLDF
jgi:cob(I)alamin adenosyltransferase